MLRSLYTHAASLCWVNGTGNTLSGSCLSTRDTDRLEMRYRCLSEDISILVMGDASDITEYDRRRSELSNAAL